MAAVTSNTGLVSGLDIKGIVGAIMTAQQAAVSRLQDREKAFQTTQTGFNTLSANLLPLSTSAAQLAANSTFSTFKANSSDPSQLTATATGSALPGTYQFQTLRLATAQQMLSKGYANTDVQAVGAGTLSIASGGRLSSPTTLDTLNGGNGVRRGIIRITDRSGASADVDLNAAVSVDDVLAAINNTEGISVVATAHGDKIEIADTTGSTSSNLIVAEKNGGHAAQDLGINKSVATNTLSGNAVYQVTGAFALSRLDDGNGPRFTDNVADIRIQLTDVPATQLNIDLNGAATLGDVINKINNDSHNAGKVTASLVNGHIVLTDNTGGGGSQPLSVTDINGATAVRALGLDQTAVGNTLTGGRIVAGINSVLLHNLRGGQGIDQLGSITLTDRAGTSATIDLSTATSLDEVINAINGARDPGDVKLRLTASLNAAGNGLQIVDSSGDTASNLIIADVVGSTLAAQLGIAVDAAQNSVSSSSLNLRYVNEATSLSTYALGGTAVRPGSFVITDSKGARAIVIVPSQAKNLGDVIQRINTTTNGVVTAELNETGDGIVLADHAGGTGQLQVQDLNSTTAADLRITGTGTAGGDGHSRIVGRQTTLISLDADDTLQALADKINASKVGLTAQIVDDGTSFSPKRLVLTASRTGSAGGFLFDDGSLGLGLEERSAAQNALLRVGADSSGGFLISSSTNHFEAVQQGLSIDVKDVGDSVARVDVSQDTGKIMDLVSGFVKNYNTFVAKSKELTKFDTSTNTSGPLQGEGLALRLNGVLSDLVSGSNFGPSGNAFKSLREFGVNFNSDGTLAFSTSKLSAALTKNPQAVSDFFLTAQNGFAAKLKQTVESFTDPLTGKITVATNSLQASVDTLEKRITTLNSVLQVRQQRLLTQFYNLESVLSGLQTQQQALGKLQNLYGPVSSGGSSG